MLSAKFVVEVFLEQAVAPLCQDPATESISANWEGLHERKKAKDEHIKASRHNSLSMWYRSCPFSSAALPTIPLPLSCPMSSQARCTTLITSIAAAHLQTSVSDVSYHL